MEVFSFIARLLLSVADFGLWLLLGLLALIAAGLTRRYLRGRWRIRLATAGLILVAVALLAISGYQFWFTHRPIPPDMSQELYPGVLYRREARAEPRPLVIHTVRIDLNQPGLEFHITPGNSATEYPLMAQTASQFLRESGVQIAINAGFFTPWWSRTPWDYYPHPGEPVTVKGLYSAEGVRYGIDVTEYPVLYLSEDGQPQFEPPTEIYNAIAGNYLFIQDGEVELPSIRYNVEIHPRTVIAFDADFQIMLWILIDGRQPNYSEGVTMFELAEIARDMGVDYALNLDGGGSTTLVVEGEDGQPVVLNSPIDQGLPGRERYIASHLGLAVTEVRTQPTSP